MLPYRTLLLGEGGTRTPSGQSKVEVFRNSVPGCLASAPGSESGILLSTGLQAQSSQLTTRSALDHSAPRPHTQCCKFSGSALSSSQIFRGLLPAPLFRKAFPLCCRSYLPACFLLVKGLALIHLHKQEAPQSEVSLASAWLERVSAEPAHALSPGGWGSSSLK